MSNSKPSYKGKPLESYTKKQLIAIIVQYQLRSAAIPPQPLLTEADISVARDQYNKRRQLADIGRW